MKKKLEEAIKEFKRYMKMVDDGCKAVEWEDYCMPTGCAVYVKAHEILNLLAEMGITSDWFHGGKRRKTVTKENDHITILIGNLATELQARGHANTFPDAILGAIESKKFKEWLKEQK